MKGVNMTPLIHCSTYAVNGSKALFFSTFDNECPLAIFRFDDGSEIFICCKDNKLEFSKEVDIDLVYLNNYWYLE
ncbi:hypothetical protein KNT64_gp169 [Pseudomonas phage PspYZU05]|uniref:Uncharacterized protein n=1 Tax=Pseudomonas phage PspYZU05 TaxID=1983556 RepID=A0A2U7NF66_9CAUD|nr:hypothetical protein KNT64_gp169 [Pseudomonas phage PspYZU05]ASD52121.1 hypothetical protein PspYZU05_169 [Pseudomonas phage PspYZU05]